MSEQEGYTLAGFKKELAELLHKYDAFLGVNVYGDTHNLDYRFYVNLGGGRNEHGWRIGSEHTLRQDNEIEAKDLDYWAIREHWIDTDGAAVYKL